MEVEHFTQLETTTRIFVDQLGYVSELLSKRNCDTNKNYQKCIDSKLQYYKDILKLTTQYIPKENILSNIKEVIKTNQTEYILIFIQDIFALTNNFDCVRDEATFNTLYQYVEEVVNRAYDLFDLLNPAIEDAEVVNYANYMATSVANSLTLCPTSRPRVALPRTTRQISSRTLGLKK